MGGAVHAIPAPASGPTLNKSPYIPFYPSDWLAGTRGLTAAETGVYITIISMIYEREAPLDMPDERLARLCGCTVTNFRKAIGALIEQRKLIRVEGGLWNERAECELEKRTAKRSDAKTAATKRWEKTQQNQSNDDADAMRTQCGNDANQNQNHIKNRDTIVSLAPECLEGFDDFWEQYPHRNGAKKGKAVAQKSWLKAIRSRASPSNIIAGAMRYATDRQVLQGYAKDPATWLNQKGWEDDVEPAAEPRRIPQGRANRADPALENILRLAGLGQASGNDRS